MCQLDMYSGRNSLSKKNELFDGTLARTDAAFVPERVKKAFGHLLADNFASPLFIRTNCKFVHVNCKFVHF